MPAKMKSQEEHIADADAILAENGGGVTGLDGESGADD